MNESKSHVSLGFNTLHFYIDNV